MKTGFDVYGRIAAVFVFVFFLCFLDAMFRREAVKRDLTNRGCTPLHIWWIPSAFSIRGLWDTLFRVSYRDDAGLIHKAFCCVYLSLMENPFGRRRVRWLKDKIKAGQ